MKNIKIFLFSLIYLISFNLMAENKKTYDYNSEDADEITLEYIEYKLRYINSDINIIQMYETIDALTNAQFLEDIKIKNKAADALFEIANTVKLPKDLRRNSLISAIGIKQPIDASFNMLMYGREEDLISGDKYYGMLSTYFNSGDESLKYRIIDEVLSSNSAYGKHIFMLYNKDSSALTQLSPELLKYLKQKILLNIPGFTSPKNILNVIDYNAIILWVEFYKNIESIEGNSNSYFQILNHMTNEDLDPKYMVALIYSPLFDDIINNSENKKIIYSINNKINKAKALSIINETYNIDVFLQKALEKLNM